MKKKSIKNLSLHKNVISDLEKIHDIKGGKYSTNCWTDILKTYFIACPEPIPASDIRICTLGMNDCPIL